MANPIVLINAVIGLGGVDISARSNEAKIELDATAVDISTFGDSGWKKFAAGLKSGSGTISGFVDFGVGALDPVLFSEFGSSTATAVSIAASRTVGDIAYLIESLETSYSPGATTNEAMSFSAAFNSRSRTSTAGSSVGRGNVIFVDPAGAHTTTQTSGTVLIAESTRLRMNAHVFGTSITGTVTPQIDWSRDGGGASGTEVGNAINPGSSDVIDVAWPDPGNDLDVGVTLTAASSPTFGYLVTAAAIA